LHDLSPDELYERFEAVRKVALDSLDGQAYSPQVRELKRIRFENLDFGLFTGTYLYPLMIPSALPPGPSEEEELRKRGVYGDLEVTGTYPDHELHRKREFFAELELLRIFYVAAARDILSSAYSTLNES
jgi:hypothetical protein